MRMKKVIIALVAAAALSLTVAGAAYAATGGTGLGYHGARPTVATTTQARNQAASGPCTTSADHTRAQNQAQVRVRKAGSGAASRNGNGPAATGQAGNVSQPGTATTILIPLSDVEKSALLFMREEEKLARDVYTTLYAKWGVPVFSTIATSESRHMASIKTLLDRYGLTDPVAVDTLPGVFVNSELQAAYTQLVAQGNRSLEEALKAGVTIETLDIEDLQALIAVSAHNDATQVAQNLLRGSQNHRAAFTRILAN